MEKQTSGGARRSSRLRRNPTRDKLQLIVQRYDHPQVTHRFRHLPRSRSGSLPGLGELESAGG